VAAAGISLLIFHACCLLVFATKGITVGLHYAEAVLLHLCAISLLAAMTLFLSTLLSAPSSVIGIGLLLYLFLKCFGSNIEILVNSGSGAAGTAIALIYTIIPHFEFFDMGQRVVFSGAYPPIGVADMLFFIGYTAAYSTLFLSLAWLAFRKKNL